MTAYYNEIEPFAAEWLKNLIAKGLIAPGDVDTRSIKDVKPDDLRGYDQCHFFAGIGLWSHALRLAGWPDDRPVWTGSCPCQPFSAAGRRAGAADERHLWPHWFHLVGECAPPVVLGEQVASKDGLGWLDLVQADLEGAGYAVGAADMCAAGIGAPHIRQRLWFVASRLGHDGAARRERGDCGSGRAGDQPGAWRRDTSVAGASASGRLADADGRDTGAERQQPGREQRQQQEDRGVERLAEPRGEGREQERADAGGRGEGSGAPGLDGRFVHSGSLDSGWPRQDHDVWRDADWLFCRDGKWRPVEPGTFPLAHGYPQRVGRLRAYGNAIVPQVAATFIEAYLDASRVGF